jgi:hypothetical protein
MGLKRMAEAAVEQVTVQVGSTRVVCHLRWSHQNLTDRTSPSLYPVYTAAATTLLLAALHSHPPPS